ncbi:MFS transporter [Candidatus Gracilibacteria bacterium]|nr:MFS transporter [Candidatus Gracilibacteria bacterium]
MGDGGVLPGHMRQNTEPPLWLFNPPTTSAFNASWANYGLWMSFLALGSLSLVLISGVLGDIFGRRRVMLIGLVGLLVANVLAIIAPTPPVLLVSRVIASIFGPLVLPLSLSILFLAFADDELARSRALAVFVLLTNTAVLTAGLLGQLMNTLLDYRGMFLVSTVLALVAIVFIWRETTESRVPQDRRVDVVGHAAWALTVLLMMASLVAWRIDRPNARLAATLSLIGVAIGVAFLVWWDRRTPDSIFGYSQIKRRALIVLILYGACMQFGFVGLATQIRNTLQAVYGYHVVLATLALTPLLLGMAFTVFYATRRLTTVRAQPLLAASLAIGALVSLLVVLTNAGASYPWLALLLLVFGAVMVIANVTWTAVFFLAMPDDVVGVRTGINSSVFQLGGTIGGSVTAALLVDIGLSFYRQLLLVGGVPGDRIPDALAALNTILDPATPSAVLDPAIAERLLAGYQLAYLMAFNRVILLIAAVCAVGSILVWYALPRLQPAKAVEQ